MHAHCRGLLKWALKEESESVLQLWGGNGRQFQAQRAVKEKGERHPSEQETFGWERLVLEDDRKPRAGKKEKGEQQGHGWGSTPKWRKLHVAPAKPVEGARHRRETYCPGWVAFQEQQIRLAPMRSRTLRSGSAPFLMSQARNGTSLYTGSQSPVHHHRGRVSPFLPSSRGFPGAPG